MSSGMSSHGPTPISRGETSLLSALYREWQSSIRVIDNQYLRAKSTRLRAHQNLRYYDLTIQKPVRVENTMITAKKPSSAGMFTGPYFRAKTEFNRLDSHFMNKFTEFNTPNISDLL